MKFFDGLVWVLLFFVAVLLFRFIYVDTTCDVIVTDHIGDTIPRTIHVSPSGDILTGECSYKLISQTYKVS
jgi:hypothetical protein